MPAMAQKPHRCGRRTRQPGNRQIRFEGGSQCKSLQSPHVGFHSFEYARWIATRRGATQLSVVAALYGDLYPAWSIGRHNDADGFNQDTDFDGVLDYSYLAPFAVSGVCANGVIACDSGTWTNCTPEQRLDKLCRRQGQSSARRGQRHEAVFLRQYELWKRPVLRNIAIVLKSIGGGVVAAIHHNSSYVISDVKIDGTYAQYFGQI